MQSYDYFHRSGVHKITWEDLYALARVLAEGLAPYRLDSVVGIARAGLFPATALSCMLRCELYPARITRRVNDQVVYETPVWVTPVSGQVAGKVVAVVDEIVDSGETLRLVSEAVRDAGARTVVSACLVSHSWAEPAPDLSALVSDALVIFPWDQEVLLDGQWRLHPEIVAALEAQGKEGGPR